MEHFDCGGVLAWPMKQCSVAGVKPDLVFFEPYYASSGPETIAAHVLSEFEGFVVEPVSWLNMHRRFASGHPARAPGICA
eukprot:5512990-Pyramimonas_sp.AAC.1